MSSTLRRRDRKRLEAFVRARTEELTDARWQAASRALLALVQAIRTDATREADWDWLEAVAVDFLVDDGGSAAEVTGEALFGDDPEAQAAGVTTAMLAAMALAHADHVDYDPKWRSERRYR